MDACRRTRSLIRCGQRAPRVCCAARLHERGHRQWIGKFLFDYGSEDVVFGAHAGGATLSQKRRAVIPSRPIDSLRPLRASSDDEGPRKESLRFRGTLCDQRCDCEVLLPRLRDQDDRVEIVRCYASSPKARLVAAACRNLPQLKLSRPGWCSRALRIAISETASTTHSKFA